MLQSSNCISQDAIRNFQSRLAGKACGTSSIAGKKLERVTVSKTNKNAASKEPFQTPNRRVRRRASCSESVIDARDRAIERKYAAVRIPIVAGLPTDGGLAGYLREGTNATEINPKTAMHSASARGLETLKRPCE